MPLAIGGVVLAGVAVAASAMLILSFELDRPGRPGLTVGDQLDVVRIALIVTGGLGGVVALVVAYRRQRIAEAAHRWDEEANERAIEAGLRDEAKLFNERFASAGAQLGATSAAVRLAGVYALASLADDWPAGRRMCINVLCAYMRMPYESEETASGWVRGEREVRLSIITAVRDHLRLDPAVDSRSWREQDLDFTGAVFDGGDFLGAHFAGGIVRFTGADFKSGDVWFTDCVFSGGTVRFDRTSFSGGDIWFSGATFSGGEIWFGGAHFRGGNIWLQRAQFTGSEVRFDGALFSGGTAWLAGATISSGLLSFDNARFLGARVSFFGTRFTGGAVEFTGTKFRAGAVWFGGAVFSGADVTFAGAEFAGAKVSFAGAEFPHGKVDLSETLIHERPPSFTLRRAPKCLSLPRNLTPPKTVTQL